MRFVQDATADETLRKHEKLQDVVHGRAVMIWPPGAWSGLAVQGSLMLGWAATSIAVLFLWPFRTQHFAYFMVAAGVLTTVTGTLFYRVVRGREGARINIHRFSMIQAAVGVVVVLGCVIRSNTVSLALGSAGLVLAVIGTRLIAGPGYALLAALYRAQRAHMEEAPSGRR